MSIYDIYVDTSVYLYYTRVLGLGIATASDSPTWKRNLEISLFFSPGAIKKGREAFVKDLDFMLLVFRKCKGTG